MESRTKYRMPRLRGRRIPRAALVQRVVEAALTHAAIGIIAPAGYGKTTLLTQVAASLAEQSRVAWISLEPEDDQAATFFATLVDATAGFGLEWAEDPRRLVSRIGGAGPQARAAIGALCSALATADADTHIAILFDDVHLIGSADVAMMLETLVERLPENVVVLLAGRERPPLPFARWTVDGDAAEFDARDLAFDTKDAESIAALDESVGGDATRVRGIVELAHGWPVGTMLMLRSSVDVTRTPEKLRSEQLLFEYLANEVFAALPDDLRRFAEDVSVLPVLTPALCDAVTGRHDARAQLRALSKRDLFVATLDSTEPVLRFHDLFREFLRARLELDPPERVRGLHARAATAEADPARAIPHLLAAGQWRAAAVAIARNVVALLATGHRGSFPRWLEGMPREFVESSSEALYVRALVAWLGWNYLGARADLVRSIELQQARGDVPSTMELLVRMGLEIAVGDRAAAAVSDREIAARPLTLDERAGFALQRAWHAMGEGRIGDVVTVFTEFNDLASQAPERVCPQVADRVHSAYVGLPGMQRQYDRYLLLAGSLPAAGRTYWRVEYLTLQGWSCLWRGDRAAAESAILEARALQAHRERATPTEDALVRLEAVFLAATGDAPRALELARSLVSRFERPEAASIRVVFERAYWCGVGKVAWMCMDVATLEDVSRRLAAPRNAQEWDFIDLVRSVVRGQLRAVSRRWNEAVVALEGAVELHERLRFPQGHGDPRICLAYVHVSRGDRARAWQVLRPVVEECLAEDAAGAFVCEPREIVEAVITVLPADVRADARWQAVEARLQAWRGGEFRVRASGPLGALSDREREVLACVAEGAGNKDVARRLGLSPHTVKRHLANILDKLDCVSRRQAAELYRANAR
jgi:LuxR family maltose regulon positive regulatory protein